MGLWADSTPLRHMTGGRGRGAAPRAGRWQAGAAAIRKNVQRHARDRLPLLNPRDLRLGLAGGTMGAAAAHFSVTIARKEVAWMQGGINLQPA